MSFLASDELQGRGSGTRDEHLAALYAASLFAGFGLEPGGDHGSFLQKAPLPSPLPPNIASRLGALPRCQEQRRGTSWVFCAAPIRLRAKTRSCSPRIWITWGLARRKTATGFTTAPMTMLLEPPR